MGKAQLPFYIIVGSLFLIIAGPALFSDGMFMDGLLYATISKNLSNGIGSIWDLHLTDTFIPHFSGHPPLAFGIQSLFFDVLGDSLYTERVYSLLCFAITAWILVLIWKKISKPEFHSMAWLPLLFWFSFPLVTWAAANNMLENTMMIFTSLSVLFILKSVDNHRFINILLSGLMLFLGFFTKGFTALFPLSLFFWIWLFKRNISFGRFVIDTFLLTVAAILPLLVIWLFIPEGVESLKAYINTQVIGSLNSIIPGNSRFFILGELGLQIIPGLILISFIYIVFRLKKFKTESYSNSNWMFVFSALAVSGVIPIMISIKQRGFYILATFPFFAFVMALIVAPYVLIFIKRISLQSKSLKILRLITYSLVIISLSIASLQINRIGKDKDLLTDVYKMIDTIPLDSTISIDPSLWSKWELHGYFGRYANISLDRDVKSEHDFYLSPKNSSPENADNYTKESIPLEMFELYKRNNDR